MVNSQPNGEGLPTEMLGRQVLDVCSYCLGEGVRWGTDLSSNWAYRCVECNCVGYILGLPVGWEELNSSRYENLDIPETDGHEDQIPF